MTSRLDQMMAAYTENMYSTSILLAQSLRTEVRIRGYVPTEASDWIRHSGSAQAPNQQELGRYLSVERLGRILGVPMQVKHLPVREMSRYANAGLEQLHFVDRKSTRLNSSH